MAIGGKTRNRLLEAQRNEITEYHIYNRLAGVTSDDENRKVLREIARDEKRHYDVWRKYTKQDVEPSRSSIWKYYLVSRLFGLTFGLKFMEKGEKNAQFSYGRLPDAIPEARRIEKEEKEHEKELIDMIKEEKLLYVGSIVLGLNDALVELTGALAGFTFALADTGLIALAGLITGIAASLSMGASEYLSTKSERNEDGKSPLRASVYTTIAYIATVAFLIAPFLMVPSVFLALGVTLMNAIIVILIFTFYISVAKDLPFRRRFLEMATISMGVAGLSFVIGFLIKSVWGI